MSNRHSGSAPAAGYMFQAQWALLELLRASDSARPDVVFSLELFDDVAWDANGSPIELIQVKHHLNTSRQLADTSPDVWKTIGVWLDAEPSQADAPCLTLVTTETAVESSGVASLRPYERDTAEAVECLLDAAKTSSSETTRAVRDRFIQMAPHQRQAFVGRIVVLDGAPVLGDVEDLVRRQLRFALPQGHEEVFMALVWDWWYRIVSELLKDSRGRISATAVQSKIDDIRDGFARDSLPTLVAESEIDVKDTDAYLDRIFVHQLRWVNTPTKVLRKSIIDFYRSVTQSARWLDEDLIASDELDTFERKLVDEWERDFEFAIQDLPPDADEATKQRLGSQLLREALDQTSIAIRERYNEPFFARGVHHDLADRGEVGWHPEFRERVEELLLGAGGK